MLKQITEWNTVKKIWMIGEQDLFLQQYRPYSGRWPISGMMRNGVVYELPMQEHPTTVSESLSSPTQVFGTPTTATSGRSPEFCKGSNPNPVEFAEDLIASGLLPTPTTMDVGRSTLDAERAKELKVQLSLGGRIKSIMKMQEGLLPTPAVGHIRNHDEPIEDYLARRQKMIDGVYKGMPGVSLGVAVRMEMMPTPVASEGTKAPAQQDAETKGKTGQVWLSNVAKSISNDNEVVLLGTPRVSAANSSTPKQVEAGATKSRIEDQVLVTNWGKFGPAIERWESLTRPAPAPTKPDGKDGNHRLSAEFTEWMMGLPAGWVTAEDIGLKRNDQLKACGNGVVPQQAELALRMLLQDTDFDSKIKVESALGKELTPHNR